MEVSAMAEEKFPPQPDLNLTAAATAAATSMSSSTSSDNIVTVEQTGKQEPIDQTTANKKARNKKPQQEESRRFHRRRRRVNSYKRSASSTSWQQRQEDIRRRRAALQRQSLGISVAPYNTTQFLMEEHQGEVDEEELLHPRRKRGDSFNSVEDSFGEDYNSSSYEDDEYLHAQFCAEYDSVASERLHAMSKIELVHEFIMLESRIDSLESELQAVKKAEQSDEPMEVPATQEDIAKINVFQEEIAKLMHENRRLQKENEHLQQNIVIAEESNAADVQ